MSTFHGLEDLREAFAPHDIGVSWVDDVLVFDFWGQDEPHCVRLAEPEPLGETPQERICVIVVGIPRSGTSCVAGTLHHLGVRMGPFDTTVDEANPAGYFEHKGMVDFHGQFVGRGVDGWRMGRDRFVFSDEVRLAYRDLVAHSEEAVGPRGLWGFKDLRFFHVVAEFAVAVDSRVKMVEVVRSPEAVRRSMLAYPGFSEQWPGEVEEVMLAWAKMKAHALSVLTVMLDAPRLVVTYESMLTDPSRAVRELAAFVGVEPTKAAVEFIDPRLNRQGR